MFTKENKTNYYLTIYSIVYGPYSVVHTVVKKYLNKYKSLFIECMNRERRRATMCMNVIYGNLIIITHFLFKQGNNKHCACLIYPQKSF